jgi:hypothetical protein
MTVRQVRRARRDGFEGPALLTHARLTADRREVPSSILPNGHPVSVLARNAADEPPNARRVNIRNETDRRTVT